MMRTDSIHAVGPATTSSPARSTPGQHRHRRTPLAHGLCLIGIALAWSACSQAASGPGLAFKVGAQTLEDPIDQDDTTRLRVEVELSTARFFDEHVDLAFAFGGSPLGTHRETYTDYVDDVYMEDTYRDTLSLLDVRFAARLYPLGSASEIRPYLGAGIGYFWLLDAWRDTLSDTIQDPVFPDVYHTYTDEYEGHDTPAEGFFPFIMAGVTFPLGDNGELLLEFQYDIEKEDNDFDLGGPIFMIGGRIRF
ncbi:MAG: hypothetical protein ABFD90_01750 [Phycisphaerales bacterium]